MQFSFIHQERSIPGCQELGHQVGRVAQASLLLGRQGSTSQVETRIQ